MIYTQTLMVKLLELFIKTAQAADNLKIIAHQAFDIEVLTNAINTSSSGKVCYLLASEETIYHAFMTVWRINEHNSKEIALQYVYAGESQPLASELLISYRKKLQQASKDKTYSQFLPFIYPIASAIEADKAFIETLGQLLTPEPLIHSSIPIAARQAKLLQTLACSQLNELSAKHPEVLQSIRLIFLHNALAQTLNVRVIKPLAYSGKKIQLYKQTNSINEYLKHLPEDIVLAIATANTAKEVLSLLDSLRKKHLASLLKKEQSIFPALTTQQQIKKLAELFYYQSPLGLFGELTQLIRLILPSNYNMHLIKQFTLTDMFQIIGWATGSYFVINSTPYTLIKPTMTYYLAEYLAGLQQERIDDEHGAVIAPYLPFKFELPNWLLLMTTLFLLTEALCSENNRELTYAGFAIAINLLFTHLAKSLLPMPNDDPVRVPLVLLIGLFGRTLSNLAVAYGYAVSDNNYLCEQAKTQFETGISGTVALETACSSSWTAGFWGSKPKLNALATNSKGQTFAIECNIPLADCEVIEEYPNRLLKPS